MRFCEMKKSDFKVGQKVYLLAINDNARYLKDGETKIVDSTVTKIGSKYITVKIDNYYDTSIQFDIENGFMQRTNGSPNWKLMFDVSQIDEEKEADNLTRTINSIFTGYTHSYCELSLDKLRRICKIIEE